MPQGKWHFSIFQHCKPKKHRFQHRSRDRACAECIPKNIAPLCTPQIWGCLGQANVANENVKHKNKSISRHLKKRKEITDSIFATQTNNSAIELTSCTGLNTMCLRCSHYLLIFFTSCSQGALQTYCHVSAQQQSVMYTDGWNWRIQCASDSCDGNGVGNFLALHKKLMIWSWFVVTHGSQGHDNFV